MTAIETYAAPTSVEEALEVLRGGDDVTLLAGGTDLMPQSQAGRVAFGRTLMNIRGIAALRGIARDGGALRIGALTTITDLLDSPLVAEHLPVLARAADRFASPQVRNAGTVGGNICNASPAGDTLVPLIALGAEVELAAKPNGSVETRAVPLEEFFAGPSRTHRRPHELLTAVRVPMPPSGAVTLFEKFGTRPALDISTVSVGLTAVCADGVLSDVRMAVGAVAPTPVRARAAEAALEGRRLDGAAVAEAAAAARDGIDPIDDVRATAWYRKELVHNLVKRMLSHVVDM